MIHLTESHLSQLVDWYHQFFWPFIRLGGLMMIAPVIGDNRVPVRIRLMLCLALTAVVAPTIGTMPTPELLSAQWILIVFTQILIGVALGLMLQLVFNAMVVAGESIAFTMGLGYALMNDPSNGVQIPVVSQFYSIFVTLLFLAFEGHHALIALVVESFALLPVGEAVTGNMLWNIIEWSSVLFVGALQVALPALAALLSVNLIMGIMARAAPQLNIFSVGFPITMLVGFFVLVLTLPTVASTFQSLVFSAFDNMSLWLEMR